MSFLPDDVKLNTLSIPGTHDSMTSHSDRDDLIFGCKTWIGLIDSGCMTQDWLLQEQLARGIRFIDIRIKQIDGVNELYHGSYDLDTNLIDVLEILKKWLNENPQEMVIMSWQPNYVKDEPPHFTSLFQFQRDLDKYQNIIYQPPSNIQDLQITPTLGEVRGKIFLMKCPWPNMRNLNCLEEWPGSTAFLEETSANNWDAPVAQTPSSCIEWFCTMCIRKSRWMPYAKSLTAHVLKAGARAILDKFYMLWVSYSPPQDSCRFLVTEYFFNSLDDWYKKPEVVIYSTGIVILDYPTINQVTKIVNFNQLGI